MTHDSFISLNSSASPFETIATLLWQEKLISSETTTASKIVNLKLLYLDHEKLPQGAQIAIKKLQELFIANNNAATEEHCQKIASALSELYHSLILSNDLSFENKVAALKDIFENEEQAKSFIEESQKHQKILSENNGRYSDSYAQHIFSLFCKKSDIPQILSTEEQLEQYNQRYCLQKDLQDNFILLLNKKALPTEYSIPEPKSEKENPFAKYFKGQSGSNTMMGLGVIAATIASLLALFFRGRKGESTATKNDPQEKNSAQGKGKGPVVFSRIAPKKYRPKVVSKTVMTSNKYWKPGRRR